MKRIILLFSAIFISISAFADGLPKIEIIEYGIYSRIEPIASLWLTRNVGLKEVKA